eukprot:gene17488-biopygen20379
MAGRGRRRRCRPLPRAAVVRRPPLLRRAAPHRPTSRAAVRCGTGRTTPRRRRPPPARPRLAVAGGGGGPP